MPTAWRIVKQKLEATAFDGEGARLYGGRWNTRGHSVIYTASSQSLAALEIVVHVSRAALLQEYVVMGLHVPNRLIEYFEKKKLPPNWSDSPPPIKVQQIGDGWLQEERSLALAVPSTIVPAELNYLLNPAHTEFPALFRRQPERFIFDERLAAG